jgi:IS30 family transposase
MDKRYKHLNGEERGVFLAEHRRGASLGAIGALLGGSASTIGRELRRDRPLADPAQPYCARLGADRYRALRKRCGRRGKLIHLKRRLLSRLRAGSSPCISTIPPV